MEKFGLCHLIALCMTAHLISLSVPEKPACESFMSRDSPALRCRTDRVYPKASCKVLWNDNDFGNGPWIPCSCNNSLSSRIPGYYISECVMTFDSYWMRYWYYDGFNGLGSFYQMRIFPDVNGGDNYGVDSSPWRLEFVRAEEGKPDQPERNETQSCACNQTCPDVPRNAANQSTSNNSAVPRNAANQSTSNNSAVVIGLGLLCAVLCCVTVVLGIMVFRHRRSSSGHVGTKNEEVELPVTGQSVRRYDQLDSTQDDLNVNDVHCYQNVNPYEIPVKPAIVTNRPKTENTKNYVNMQEVGTVAVQEQTPPGEDNVYENTE